MKKWVFIIVLGCCSSYSQSQPVITASAIPSGGNGEYVQYCYTQNVEPGDSGINQFWDFSNVDTWGLDINWYYEFDGLGDFPNSNLKSNNEQYMFFLGPHHFDEYYKADSNALWYYGNSPDTVPEGLSAIDPLKLLQYPFTYGSSFIDSFYFYNPDCYYQCQQWGVDSFLADAYGTIITPQGIFMDAIRTQTICNHYFRSYSVYQKGREVNYCWFVPYYQFPILTVNLTYGHSPVYDADSNIIDFILFPTPTFKKVFYNSGVIPVNVFSASPHSSIVNIYPNPFHESTAIQFSLPNFSEVKVELFDLHGRKVKTIAEGNFTEGNHKMNFSAGDLPRGIYLLQLKTDSGIFSRRVVIQ